MFYQNERDFVNTPNFDWRTQPLHGGREQNGYQSKFAIKNQILHWAREGHRLKNTQTNHHFHHKHYQQRKQN